MDRSPCLGHRLRFDILSANNVRRTTASDSCSFKLFFVRWSLLNWKRHRLQEDIAGRRSKFCCAYNYNSKIHRAAGIVDKSYTWIWLFLTIICSENGLISVHSVLKKFIFDCFRNFVYQNIFKTLNLTAQYSIAVKFPYNVHQ